MRLISYQIPGCGPRPGMLVQEDWILDLNRAVVTAGIRPAGRDLDFAGLIALHDKEMPYLSILNDTALGSQYEEALEIAGLGLGPFAAMLLSEMGADVVRTDRPDAQPGSGIDLTGRGRTTVLLDLKDQADRERAIRLIERADILSEGFRPGVMERLGLGPAAVADCNPRLVYGRMTGWGQDGPLARAAGHDINYIAITGALDAIGPAGGPPVPPLNLVGDYGGGALYLALGTLAELIGSPIGTGASRRCGNLRRHGLPHDQCHGPSSQRHQFRRPGCQSARWRRALLWRL